MGLKIKSKNKNSVIKFVNSLKLFGYGYSWGGFESLAISPQRPDNAEALKHAGLPQGLIRLSVGLESADTLINDLSQALSHAK